MEIKYKLVDYEFYTPDPEDYEERMIEKPEPTFEKINLIENKPVCGKWKIISGGDYDEI